LKEFIVTNTAVMCIGIVLMPILIRFSTLMPIQIRIRIHILPQLLHIRIFFFTFIHSSRRFTLLCLSRQSHGCNNYQYFGQYIEISGKNGLFGKKWIPIRIRIYQNDADSTGSGSTTLAYTFSYVSRDVHCITFSL
jgi:hypothetical protein